MNTTARQHCITCGRELAAERAEKYDYCTDAHCQKGNLKGVPLMAVGVNKSAEHYVRADEKSQLEMASGMYRDQRRALYGKQDERGALRSPEAPVANPAAPDGRTAASAAKAVASASKPPARARRRLPNKSGAQPANGSAKKPAHKAAWTPAQQSLAMIYNARGMRPDEIAAKLGVSRYLATQMILAAKSRGR